MKSFICASLLAAATAVAGSKPVPLIIWHGLGDSYNSEGLQSIGDLAEELAPGTFTHIIRLNEDPSSDRSATFFGLVDTQIAQVCQQLAEMPELEDGFNAIGFSQGGQFLRGYVERCNDPPVKTLVTYGSQHNGITDFLPSCEYTDFLCKSAAALLRGSKWNPLVQNRLVPAQYYRDPEDLQSYLDHSAFLADINNERPEKRESGENNPYKWRLAQLEKFVMVMFANDTTVVPKETSWFAELNRTTGEVTKLEDRPIYKEDWIGLKHLGDAGKIEYLTEPGEHMRISEEGLKNVFKKYLLGGKTENAKHNDL